MVRMYSPITIVDLLIQVVGPFTCHPAYMVDYVVDTLAVKIYGIIGSLLMCVCVCVYAHICDVLPSEPN